LLSRVAEVDTKIRAFVPEDGREERVREAALAIEAEYAGPSDRPPLYGVPIGVKDVFRVDGLETRAGSDLPPEVLAGPEASAVIRLREAGGVILGKTVTTELAYFDPGPTRNPRDTDHTPGGSSSGSAAAVAAGLCPLALGTQTVGSVIRPAAFCGVVGFTPTYGRVPTDGVLPVSPAVDRVGWFTQVLADARPVAAVLCEDWRVLPEPREHPTLGVPEGPYLEQASDAGLAAFEEHVDLLAEAYDIERVPVLEDIEAINRRHEELMAAEMAIAHGEWYDAYADRYADVTSALIERGRSVRSGDIARDRRGRTDLRETVESRMDEAGVDAWITPAAPGPAPEGIEDTGDPVMNLPWSHAGLPAVSIPAGNTDDGLPLGIQCVARPGADEDLLAWGPRIGSVLGESSGR